MAPRKAVDVEAVIGWREWVELPELGIVSIKAKVDTGARTSSLHAYDLEVHGRKGRERVSFSVHPEQRNSEYEIRAEAPLVEWRRVRPSTGRPELRPVVRTRVVILDQSHDVELTLTRRDAMGFRMLLGREALRGRLVVDPGRSYLGGRRFKGSRRIKKQRKKEPGP
jgi:hypothetical protein